MKTDYSSSMTQGGKIGNTVFWITLRKTKSGFYFVDLCFLCDGTREEFCLNDRLNIDLTTLKAVNPGQSWEKNPYNQVVDYCKGFIEARENNPNMRKIKTSPEAAKELDRLFELFPPSTLAAMTGLTNERIRQWKSRGVISDDGVRLVCDMPQVKAMGFSVESLRPDLCSK